VLAAGGTLTYAQMLSAPGLAEVARYADWIAPWSRTLMAVAPDGRLAPPQPIIADAHRVGLLVGAYTFRPEPQFLPPALRQCGAALRCESGSVAEIAPTLPPGSMASLPTIPALAAARSTAPDRGGQIRRSPAA
jgi:glycerophosphoryl diester phosphodiesterase